MRALLTWELSGGLGHMMNLRPLAAELAARGHDVYLAAGDLTRAVDVFGEAVGDCPNFPMPGEENGTVPFSETASRRSGIKLLSAP